MRFDVRDLVSRWRGFGFQLRLQLWLELGIELGLWLKIRLQLRIALWINWVHAIDLERRDHLDRPGVGGHQL